MLNLIILTQFYLILWSNHFRIIHSATIANHISIGNENIINQSTIGWNVAKDKAHQITIGSNMDPSAVERHVVAGIDVILFCQLNKPLWFRNNQLLESDNAQIFLKSIQSEDAGIYSCLARTESKEENKWSNLTLKVDVKSVLNFNDDLTSITKFEGTDEDKQQQEQQKLIDSSEQETEYAFQSLNGTLTSAPKFKQSSKLLAIIQRTIGGLLQLSCPAFGIPIPNITWYHNSTILSKSTVIERYKFKKWSILVDALTFDDAGSYKCEVCNELDCIEHSTKVIIVSRIRAIPYIRDNMPQNVSVPINENVQFDCPVVSDLEPHIVWVRDKRPGTGTIEELETALDSIRNIDEVSGIVERLTTSEFEPQVLRLGNVQKEDEGWYTCIAANSLGRTMASAYLKIEPLEQNKTLEENDKPKIDTEYGLNGSNLELEHDVNESEIESNKENDTVNIEESKPTFRKQLVSLIHKPSGSSIQLSCPALGNPIPNITWSRNDTEIMRHIGKVTYKKWSIQMDDIITEDSGIYICVLCNRLDCIRHSFKLIVNDRLRSRPIHSDRYPQNQTVLVNSSVTFECKVVSDLEPLIWWIHYKQKNKTINELEKSIPQGSQNLSERYANDFVKLPTDPDRTNILQLKNVTYTDAGWYTCIAANTLGESMASGYLKVVDKLPSREVYTLLRSHPIWFTVAPIVIILIFLLGSIFIIYVLRKLKQEKLLKHRIETVHQWTKKVVIYRPASSEGSSCDLHMPVIRIEKQRTTFQTSSNVDPTQAFNEYEFPLDSNWEIERNNLALGSTLGEGAFGRVVMAEASGLPRAVCSNNSSTIVAVKMVKDEHTDADMASLVREMEVMKLIGKHINIINLLGCCSQNGPLWVIVEYAPFGNLKDFLKKNRPVGITSCSSQRRDSGYLQEEQDLTETNLISFAFQIARGMEYLASRRCIHRDLAARNVLVSDNFVMKIADFGLARDIQDTEYYRKNTNGRLPIKWMAPESLQDKFYDSQSDVWSYGVLLWEIMTYGEQPYPNIMSAEELYSYLITNQRMEKPARCSLNIYMLMRQCWQIDAHDRPTFTEIVENLDKILLLANSSVNEDYLDVSMPMLETPPSSSDDDSETESFRESSPIRYHYTYKY